MSKIVGVANIIINNERKVLLAKRRKETGRGYYAGIGGIVETNETYLDAVVRETIEEVEITPINPKPICITYADNNNIKTAWFLTKKFNGEPRNKEEDKCEHIKWFAYDELPNKLWLGLDEILKQLKERNIL
jgi:ADP-ribose pyrophosphatase YjhB (NUDIX family)